LILSQELCRQNPREVLSACLRGGADLVQIREKNWSAHRLLAWVREAQALCRPSGVPLIVNDSVEVAAAAGADGVHLGQEDLAPAAARRILGPGKWIGWSTHDLEQLERAAQDPAVDYVGFGPAFATATKGISEGLGPDRVKSAAARAAEVSLPILVIGGITVENRGNLGGNLGIAVCSALCGAADPEASARRLHA
jgi:thiamine-phosphate pyrophosphorylase